MTIPEAFEAYISAYNEKAQIEADQSNSTTAIDGARAALTGNIQFSQVKAFYDLETRVLDERQSQLDRLNAVMAEAQPLITGFFQGDGDGKLVQFVIYKDTNQTIRAQEGTIIIENISGA